MAKAEKRAQRKVDDNDPDGTSELAAATEESTAVVRETPITAEETVAVVRETSMTAEETAAILGKES